ncbi:MAG: hypothetical protein ACP5XB_31630 [Isosphaeraceae bacterium]
MPSYESTGFDPPAPVARVMIRAAASGSSVADVPLLVDSGADVTLLPRFVVDRIGIAALTDQQYELIGFDGTRSFAPAAVLDMVLFGRVFRGRYLLIDGDHGVLGRDVLNHLVLLLDGPARQWSEQTK